MNTIQQQDASRSPVCFNSETKSRQNRKFCIFICVSQKKVVTLQRKMNRALVVKKVLQYLAHAEGICLSGGGKYRTY